MSKRNPAFTTVKNALLDKQRLQGDRQENYSPVNNPEVINKLSFIEASDIIIMEMCDGTVFTVYVAEYKTGRKRKKKS